jgi:aryl-alcohol dehydrogenase-like predicted oxidoreductase
MATATTRHSWPARCKAAATAHSSASSSGGLRAASGQFLGIDVRPAAVKNFAAYSLQRLGVDVIDLYQPGRLDHAVPVEETIGAVAELIAEGKVRYLGLSEVTAAQLRAAHREYPVTALEIEYSLATRSSSLKSCLPHANSVSESSPTESPGTVCSPARPHRRVCGSRRAFTQTTSTRI